jgi:hypothetical protein
LNPTINILQTDQVNLGNRINVSVLNVELIWVYRLVIRFLTEKKQRKNF